MRFPGIRLVEQTEKKIRRFESVLKKSDCNSWAFINKSAEQKHAGMGPSWRRAQGSKRASALNMRSDTAPKKNSKHQFFRTKLS